MKLLDDILMCRRALLDNEVVQNSLPEEVGFFRSAISKYGSFSLRIILHQKYKYIAIHAVS